MTTEIEKKKIERFRVLESLYTESDGNSQAIFQEDDFERIANQLGISMERLFQHLEYLGNERLVVRRGIGYETSVAHRGVLEIEAAHSKPTEATEHFPPFIHVEKVIIGNVENSQIQIGTHDSKQSATFSNNEFDRESLRTILKTLGEAMDRAAISVSTLTDFKAQLDTVQAQLRASKPSSTILKEGLLSLKGIAEIALGDAVAHPLVAFMVAHQVFK